MAISLLSLLSTHPVKTRNEDGNQRGTRFFKNWDAHAGHAVPARTMVTSSFWSTKRVIYGQYIDMNESNIL